MAKSENDIVFQGNVIDERRTIASFTVPSGPRTVYLRTNEQTENPSATSVVDVTVDLMDFRAGFGPPPNTLTNSGVATILPTDPYGDGGIDASFLPGTGHRYAFQAPAGVMSVEVAPDQPGNTTVRWGVYANIVECSANRPMRNRSVAMNPLSPIMRSTCPTFGRNES